MTDSGAATPTYRLPDTSRPHRYDITLAPNLERSSFEGHERIEIEIVAPTSLVVLNSVEIVLGDASATVGWASDAAPASDPIALGWSHDEALEMVSLSAPSALPVG